MHLGVHDVRVCDGDGTSPHAIGKKPKTPVLLQPIPTVLNNIACYSCASYLPDLQVDFSALQTQLYHSQSSCHLQSSEKSP